jgi:hypothetical protein
MRSLRYLNAVLTVLAVLLALNLWTTWTGGPAWDRSAMAARGEEGGAGIPNSAQQRAEMIDLLKRLVQENNDLSNMFRTGRARVQVDGGK